jgi:hypothetical protein
MKDQIIKLYKEGKSYREIADIVHCSRGLISYYINPDGKAKTKNRNAKNRYAKRDMYKGMLGGKCQVCGYSKCIDALQFHHKDPSQKSFGISEAMWGHSKKTEEEIVKEIKKCSLLCANCHAEVHAGIITLDLT